ncbi:hypothetical protein L208DRAFT_1331461, partial [Tricholoma matsutake]
GQPKPLAKGNPKLKLYYIIQALGAHLAKGNRPRHVGGETLTCGPANPTRGRKPAQTHVVGTGTKVSCLGKGESVTCCRCVP